MRKLAPAIAALALLAGCGGGDDEGGTIPARQANALTTQLDNVAGLMDRDPPICGSSTRQLGELQAKIDALPADVDADVKSKLEEGFANLTSLVEQECAAAQPEETTTTEETAPPTTQPPDTEPAPSTEEEPPPDEEKDKKPKKDEEQPPGQEPDPGGEPAPGDGGTPLPGEDG